MGSSSIANELTPNHHRGTPRAWHTIGADLFALYGSEYLVVADYYSKYPFVRNIPCGQSESITVVKIMRQLFSEQGIPEVVRTDNGPHFKGQAFQEFARDLRFKHITSSLTTLVAMGL